MGKPIVAVYDYKGELNFALIEEIDRISADAEDDARKIGEKGGHGVFIACEEVVDEDLQALFDVAGRLRSDTIWSGMDKLAKIAYRLGKK